MAKETIPKEIQLEVTGIIEAFNRNHFSGSGTIEGAMKAGLEAYPV